MCTNRDKQALVVHDRFIHYPCSCLYIAQKREWSLSREFRSEFTGPSGIGTGGQLETARKSSWGPIACATDRGCVRKFAVTRMRCDVTSDEACFYESVVFFSQEGVCFRCLGCLGCLTCVPWPVCIASHRIKSHQIATKLAAAARLAIGAADGQHIFNS